MSVSCWTKGSYSLAKQYIPEPTLCNTSDHRASKWQKQEVLVGVTLLPVILLQAAAFSLNTKPILKTDCVHYWPRWPCVPRSPPLLQWWCQDWPPSCRIHAADSEHSQDAGTSAGSRQLEDEHGDKVWVNTETMSQEKTTADTTKTKRLLHFLEGQTHNTSFNVFWKSTSADLVSSCNAEGLTHLGRSSSRVHAPHWWRGGPTLAGWLGSPHRAGAPGRHPPSPPEVPPAPTPKHLQGSLAAQQPRRRGHQGPPPPRHRMQRRTAARATEDKHKWDT